MAGVNVTQVSDLLGKQVILTEEVGGFTFERRGRVTAYVATSPGSCCDPEFLLEQEDGDAVFYSLQEIRLHSVM